MGAIFLFPGKEIFSDGTTQIARSLGYTRSAGPSAEISTLIEKASLEMQAVLNPQAVFEIFDLTAETEKITFADVTINSRNLGENLKGCTKIVLLAATIGPQPDRLILKNSRTNPAYASVLHAAGAVLIEQLVDFVNDEIKKIARENGQQTRPRYSPGFGDVPLQIQRDFFRLLPCARIGLSLMDTLIMAPEKSVTAFVGLL